METPPRKPLIESEDARLTRLLIPWVMVAVVIWGGFLAFGAMSNSGNRSLHPILKGSIMFAAFLAFIAFWGLMLRYRAKRQAEEEDEEE